MAGTFAVLFSTVVGYFSGLASGIVFGTALSILGLLIALIAGPLLGGAVAAGLSFILVRRLLPGVFTTSLWAVAAAGSLCPPLLFIAGQGAGDGIVVAASVASGLVLGWATMPQWLPTTSGRGGFEVLATSLAAVAFVGIQVSFPLHSYFATQRINTAKELGCPLPQMADCLADASYLLAERAAPTWMAGRSDVFEDSASAFVLARAGHAKQAIRLSVGLPPEDRDRIAVAAAAGQVARNARERPNQQADLGPIQDLYNPVLISDGYAALAIMLTARKDPRYTPTVADTLPANVQGAPTLRRATEAWEKLVPSLDTNEAVKARIVLSRLYQDLNDAHAAKTSLEQLRGTGIGADRWLRAGDGSAALSAAANSRNAFDWFDAKGAVGMVRRQGGPDAELLEKLHSIRPRLLEELRRDISSSIVRVRGYMLDLRDLGDTSGARDFAEKAAEQARRLETPAAYAFAITLYLDLDQTGEAQQLADASLAVLPNSAVACPDAAAQIDLRRCVLSAEAANRTFSVLKDPMIRLGRTPDGLASERWSRSGASDALKREAVTARYPVAQEIQMFPAWDAHSHVEAALEWWGVGNDEGARALLMRALDGNVWIDDAMLGAQLAGAINDADLRAAFLRRIPPLLRQRNANDRGSMVGRLAVFWLEHLSDADIQRMLR